MADSGLETFIEHLKSEVHSRVVQPDQQDPDSALSEVAFAEYAGELFEVSDYLFQFEVGRFSKQLGKGQAKCNGYSYDGDSGTLWLFVVDFDPKWGETENLTAERIKFCTQSVLRFCSILSKEFLAVLEPASGEAEFSKAVLSLLSNEQTKGIRLAVLSNRTLTARKPPEAIQVDLMGRERTIVVETVDVRRLSMCALASEDREDVVFDLTAMGGVPAVCSDDGCSALAILPGLHLAQLYRDYGSRILEGNVRSYLQAKGKVNKGIIETLVDEPGAFFSFNNGLTVVCVDMEISKNGRLVKLVEPQVVNGGQTIASLYKALEANADLSPVLVQAKIVKLTQDSDYALLRKISRFSNSQNKISQADLFANEEFLVELEKASHKFMRGSIGTFAYFERSRGAYLSEGMRLTPAKKNEFERRFPRKDKFSKEEFAIAFNCWARKPHFASRGGQKNFSEFSRVVLEKKAGVFESGTYKSQVGKVVLYRLVRALVQREPSIQAYRNNVTAYAVAVVSGTEAMNEDRLIDLFDTNDLGKNQDSIRGLINVVHKLLMNQVGNRNASEVFKKEDCWLAVSEELGIKVQTEREFIRSIPLSTLIEVQQWMFANDIGDTWDQAVVGTIVNYAGSNWKIHGAQDKPSEKQVTRFQKIYNAFKTAHKD